MRRGRGQSGVQLQLRGVGDHVLFAGDHTRLGCCDRHRCDCRPRWRSQRLVVLGTGAGGLCTVLLCIKQIWRSDGVNVIRREIRFDTILKVDVIQQHIVVNFRVELINDSRCFKVESEISSRDHARPHPRRSGHAAKALRCAAGGACDTSRARPDAPAAKTYRSAAQVRIRDPDHRRSVLSTRSEVTAIHSLLFS